MDNIAEIIEQAIALGYQFSVDFEPQEYMGHVWYKVSVVGYAPDKRVLGIMDFTQPEKINMNKVRKTSKRFIWRMIRRNYIDVAVRTANRG